MDANKPPRAEPDRVSSPVVVGFGLLMVGFTVVAMVLVGAVFHGLNSRAEKRDDTAVAAAGLERRPDHVPPLPRLQVYPGRFWKDFQTAELERLESYGWMDRSTGAVHVPIERAMDLIAVRGVGPLPAAPVAMPAPVLAPPPAAEGAAKK